ncbi:MAG: hypothetical protein JSV53_09485 [candidate division WOR-3 bacterium]|nr:MAG: hypothetical protein JSV53_09485 [candidate division WOR-3 bacterium]
MEQKMDLRQLERKAWTSFYDDGLGDIFLGCIILMFAIAPMLSRMGLGDFWSSAVFLPFLALLFIVIVLLRKRVVRTRVGLVSFGRARKKRLVKFNVLMLVVLSVGFILGLLSVRGGVAQAWVHNLRFIAIVLMCFGLAGYFLGFIRLYIYGILIALAIPVGEWLWTNMGVPHHGFPVTFGVTAGVIIITGIVLFLRMLSKNPKSKGE